MSKNIFIGIIRLTSQKFFVGDLQDDKVTGRPSCKKERPSLRRASVNFIKPLVQNANVLAHCVRHKKMPLSFTKKIQPNS